MKLGTFQAHIDEMCQQKKISLEEAADLVHALGIHAVCVGADWIGDPAQERGRLERVGFHISDVFGSLNFITEEEVRPAAKRLVERAAALGADRLLVTTEPFRDRGNEVVRREDDDRAAQGLCVCCELAAANGIQVVVEDYDVNDGPFSFGDDLRYILGQAGRVGFAYDSGNFAFADEDEIANLERMRGKLAGVVHFKDRSLQKYRPDEQIRNPLVSLDGVQYYPCPVGSGIIRFEEIKKILQETGFDGTILLEHFNSPDQYGYLRESAGYVKRLFGM